MDRRPCRALAGYLEGGLSRRERLDFENHLRGCEACRSEVSDERRLDALLARAAHHLERPPLELRRTVAARIRIERARRVWLRAGAALAAAVLIVLGLRFAAIDRPAHSPAAPRTVRPVEQERDPMARRPARVEFAPDAPVIGLVVETASPDMSIVFIYPTLPPVANDEPPAGRERS